jgi:hypothetical protein
MRPARRIIVILVFAFLTLAPCFAFTHLGSHVAVVDVYIQTYVVNGQAAPSYKDERGNMHYSGKDFYLNTVDKGTMGGPVKYRYFLEHVNMTSPEAPDSTHTKYDLNAAPVFQDSKAEQIDSASVAAFSPEIFGKLPSAFTNPHHR